MIKLRSKSIKQNATRFEQINAGKFKFSKKTFVTCQVGVKMFWRVCRPWKYIFSFWYDFAFSCVLVC